MKIPKQYQTSINERRVTIHHMVDILSCSFKTFFLCYFPQFTNIWHFFCFFILITVKLLNHICFYWCCHVFKRYGKLRYLRFYYIYVERQKLCNYLCYFFTSFLSNFHRCFSIDCQRFFFIKISRFIT